MKKAVPAILGVWGALTLVFLAGGLSVFNAALVAAVLLCVLVIFS